jgi:hypothetical protein
MGFDLRTGRNQDGRRPGDVTVIDASGNRTTEVYKPRVDIVLTRSRKKAEKAPTPPKTK